VNFSESSNAVTTAFGTTGDDGRVLSTVTDMLKLIQANITVIMYTGDADYNCNWLGGEAVSKEIHAPGFSRAGMSIVFTSQ
jgi:carboxypeptidase D